MSWGLGVKEAPDLSLYSGSEAVIHEHKRIALSEQSGYEDSQCKRLIKKAFKAD